MNDEKKSLNKQRTKRWGYILAFAPLIFWGIALTYLFLTIEKPHGDRRLLLLAEGFILFVGILLVFEWFRIIKEKWVKK